MTAILIPAPPQEGEEKRGNKKQNTLENKSILVNTQQII
jgi:hypothetical protein